MFLLQGDKMINKTTLTQFYKYHKYFNRCLKKNIDTVSVYPRFSLFRLPFSSNSTASMSLPALMKALVIRNFGNVDQLVLENVPVPVCEDNEILVRIEAAGINPVDTYIRAGAYGNLPTLPAILGKEVAGVIEKIGSSVFATNPYNLKQGDRVFCLLPAMGGYAQYVTCPSDRVIPLSDKLTFSQGAGLYITYYTAYRALVYRAGLKKDETVFIHGASGGVGIAAVQIAKHLGAKVAGTAGTEKGLQLVSDLGADFVLNHKLKDHIPEAMSVTGGNGFNVILENLADLYLGEDCKILAPGGRIAVVGCRGSVEITPRSLMGTEGSILGVSLFKSTTEQLEESTKVILNGIEEGWINPIVAKEYSLENGSQAHDDIINKPASHGKLVFKVCHTS